MTLHGNPAGPGNPVFTRAEKQAALDLVVEFGYRAAAAETGVSVRGLVNWARELDVQEIRSDAAKRMSDAFALRRMILADMLGESAIAILEEIANRDDKLSDEKLKDLAQTFATLVDKMQLLSGGKTGDETTVNVRIEGWKDV